MITDSERQAIIDQEHLKLLSIAYWVWGGFNALYSIFMLLYFGLIAAVFLGVFSGTGELPPAYVGWGMVTVGLVLFAFAGLMSWWMIMTGFWIRDRRHRTATFVLAALLCPTVPFGTMIGVSTFIVLLRQSVAAIYTPPTATQPMAAAGDGGVATTSATDGMATGT